MKTKGLIAIVILIALALLGFSCSSAKLSVPAATAPTSPTAVAPSPTTTTPVTRTPSPTSTPTPTTTPTPATTATPTQTLTPTPSPTPTATATPVSSLDCQACHSDIYTLWSGSPHAATQNDVAGELADSRSGQTPHDVIQGEDPEDCIACHGPTAILASGGMSETQALGYFFTTTNGAFGADTTTAHTSDWNNVTCTVCHNVPGNHPSTMPTLSLYNSQAGQYKTVDNATALCAQCHGNLLFSGTDHLTYNAWNQSKHANTQTDVAGELADSRSGQTPADVIQGPDAENCIACHAPTAVLANGGMTETQALDYFFTTTNGTFDANTATAHTAEWPNVSCTTCHDPHNPKAISYFNSATGNYETMQSSSELCGQCHGNLRFPGTDHLSYNILQGTGGVGVADQQTMPGASCTDCHMYNSGVDGSNSASFHGHTFSVTVQEPDGSTTTSCVSCHKDMSADTVNQTIQLFQSSFQTLDTTAQQNVSAAATAMQGSTNTDLQSKFDEAQSNLSYAESDESGGFHNHNYLMSLLKDANDNALAILSALGK
jgi:formate-dependent nitrite reductase cytochrome c552 subunit